MMSSRSGTFERATRAHQAHRSTAPRAVPQGGGPAPKDVPARCEPHLDGLFTYCLSVLCDHAAATAALGEALAAAERRRPRFPLGARRATRSKGWGAVQRWGAKRGLKGLGGPPGPADPTEYRAWLYALARWACLRHLARPGHPRRRAAHGERAEGTGPSPEGAEPPQEPKAGPSAEARQAEPGRCRERRELALLAWPEAAGTTAEQREALELTVRHRLTADEVAVVLGVEPSAAREVIASAACEVERTRAAVVVVATGTCPVVAGLTGGHPLGAVLCRELTRHVDECPRCRRTAAGVVRDAWPGTSVVPVGLPLVVAPRTALPAAVEAAARARGTGPRFDRRGYPLDPKDRVAHRRRMHSRVVTTTVVATVLAAPLLSLWTAYRADPFAARERDSSYPVAVRAADAQPTHHHGAGAGGHTGGSAPAAPAAPRRTPAPTVSVEVVSPARTPSARTLTVTARPAGNITYLTLTASQAAPVHWSLRTGRAHWLHPSRASGTLAPGESAAVRVRADRFRAPSGHWTAHIAVAPADTVLLVDGYGTPGHRSTKDHARPGHHGGHDHPGHHDRHTPSGHQAHHGHHSGHSGHTNHHGPHGHGHGPHGPDAQNHDSPGPQDDPPSTPPSSPAPSTAAPASPSPSTTRA